MGSIDRNPIVDAPVTRRHPARSQKSHTDRPFGTGLTRAGTAIIGGFLAGLAGWVSLAPIESAIVAPGIVSVDSGRRTIQQLEGGIVESILTRDGDRVRAGDVLIRLRDTRRASTRNRLRAQYVESRAIEARLIAERDGSTRIRFPAELTANPGDPTVRVAMAGQTGIFLGRRETLAKRTAVLEQRIASLRDETTGLKRQINSSRKQIALIDEELAGLVKLYAKRLVNKPRLLALKRRKAEIEGEIAAFQTSIARASQGIRKTRLRMDGLRASRGTSIAERLWAVNARAYELRQQLAAAEDVLRRMEIRSPIDGTVMGLKVHTSGGVVRPGQALLDIVPVDDKLTVQASIDPRDIDQVRVGMAARVELIAFNRRSRAPIDGIVTTISADRIVDPRNGLAYYLARIELRADSPALATETPRPGMNADVMITTGARTPIEYLLTPITRKLGRALREN
jgi:membrane fusion protein, type I secretion system